MRSGKGGLSLGGEVFSQESEKRKEERRQRGRTIKRITTKIFDYGLKEK